MDASLGVSGQVRSSLTMRSILTIINMGLFMGLTIITPMWKKRVCLLRFMVDLIIDTRLILAHTHVPVLVFGLLPIALHCLTPQLSNLS